MTIQLPDSVVYGNDFRVSVHQCSGITRRIIGAFQISIPVRKAPTILGEESRALSVLRRIALAISPSDHWYPVFQRYLGQLSDHVRGLGGDPDAIRPNRDGSGSPEPPAVPRRCGERWAYAASLAAALTAMAVSPALYGPFSAVAIIAAVAFACRWWIRCRPKSCEVLTLTLLAASSAAALTAIAAIAGAGKPWTWIALAAITVAVAGLSIALTLLGCCGCEEQLGLPATLIREIGLHALRKKEPQPSPTPSKRGTAGPEAPALAQSLDRAGK